MSLHIIGYIAGFLLVFNVVQVFNTKVFLLFPKGFSINVDNHPGIVGVHFDVNVTQDNGNLTNSYHNKHVHQPFANSWTFVKRNVVINIGDTITYKISINGNNTIEENERGACKVTEVPKLGALRKHGWTFNYDVLLECNVYNESTPPAVEIKSRALATSEDVKLKLQQCQEHIFNSSLSLLSLQMEVEVLRNLTQQISNFEETYPLAKQLTLAGRIPPDGDPKETVVFMLFEKLDLKPTILSAFRDSTYSIRFTVSTIIEKLEILEVAKYMLSNSKITIT